MAWVLGAGLNDVSKFLLMFTGGVAGLIIGAVITYLIIKHLIVGVKGRTMNTQKPLLRRITS
ncbi:hypothetical protein KEJ48_01020 [Candidatus Bathyarchaeota archaeon]|nr:hypothetical protein [Candidatus Bathyarchaeota archaeon]